MVTPVEAPVSAPASVPRPNFLRRLDPLPFAFLTLGFIFVLYQVVAGVATFLLAGAQITPDNVTLVRWATLLGQFLCILLPAVILTWFRHGSILAPLRLSRPDLRQVVIVLVGTFALQQVLQGYMTLQEMIPLPHQVQKFVDMIKELFDATYRVLLTAHSPFEFVLVVATVALMPALAEEVLFRGLVQGEMERALRGYRGAILAGVIFGMYHLNPFGLVALSIIGIFLGIVVYRSGNLLLSIIAHFFNNFMAALAVYAAWGEDFVAIAPGSSPGPATIMINAALFLGVFGVAVFVFFHLTRRTGEA